MLVLLKLICCEEAVAVPVIWTCVAVPVSVCTLMTAEALPAAVGSNHTWKELDFPAGNDIGKVRPVMANWLLETLACAILTETLPVLATVAVCEIFLPTTVLPKLRLAGASWIEAWGGGAELGAPALTNPEHPQINAKGASASTNRSACD
jgi:hypothetical protein